MAGLPITEQMKVSTLQESFLKEFGLTMRVYDGRSFADPTQTLGQVRKKKGSGKTLSVENMKVKNLVDKFEDEFAAQSQARVEAAQNSGTFKEEIIPVTVKTRKEEIVIDTDEHPRHGTTVESLAKLRPAFDKEGSVTAGNASGINDGAAALILMSADEAEKRGIEPMAKIKSWATEGIDPSIMGAGPIPASKKALEKAGWSSDDLDLIEANEAFAAQACAVSKEFG